VKLANKQGVQAKQSIHRQASKEVKGLTVSLRPTAKPDKPFNLYAMAICAGRRRRFHHRAQTTHRLHK
jgi:hypothetical protein